MPNASARFDYPESARDVAEFLCAQGFTVGGVFPWKPTCAGSVELPEGGRVYVDAAAPNLPRVTLEVKEDCLVVVRIDGEGNDCLWQESGGFPCVGPELLACIRRGFRGEHP